MELAATAFMGMVSTGAATGAAGAATAATAAGAAAAGGTAAGIGSMGLGLLQGAVSAVSLISATLGGLASKQSSDARAQFADLDAHSERLNAQAEALRIKRDYLTKVGAARVAFAGSGLDISSGGAIEDSLKSQAEYEIGRTEAGGELRAAQSTARAGAYRQQGTAGLIQAAGKVAEIGSDWAISTRRRG